MFIAIHLSDDIRPFLINKNHVTIQPNLKFMVLCASDFQLPRLQNKYTTNIRTCTVSKIVMSCPRYPKGINQSKKKVEKCHEPNVFL